MHHHGDFGTNSAGGTLGRRARASSTPGRIPAVLPKRSGVEKTRFGSPHGIISIVRLTVAPAPLTKKTSDVTLRKGVATATLPRRGCAAVTS